MLKDGKEHRLYSLKSFSEMHSITVYLLYLYIIYYIPTGKSLDETTTNFKHLALYL